MKNLILFLCLFPTLAVTAPAQLCGYFGVTLVIHDGKLEPVKNASVKIIMPARKQEGKEYLRPEHKFVRDKDGAMVLTLSEGLVLSDDYQVVISAPGYLKQERTLSFPHCTRLRHDITMLKAGEKRPLVAGNIRDEKGEAVAYAGVNFVSGGRETFVNADRRGYFEVALKPGDYTVESRLMYYHTTRVEKFTVPAGGGAKLDLKMKTQASNEDKEVIIQGH